GLAHQSPPTPVWAFQKKREVQAVPSPANDEYAVPFLPRFPMPPVQKALRAGASQLHLRRECQPLGSRARPWALASHFQSSTSAMPWHPPDQQAAPMSYLQPRGNDGACGQGSPDQSWTVTPIRKRKDGLATLDLWLKP